MLKNYYPEKPILEYRRTSVSMPDVISLLQSMPINREIKRNAYILFRAESANGSSGINNNYCGFQADSGRLDPKFDNLISGIVKKNENTTGRERLFFAFTNIDNFLNMFTTRLRDRGLFIGGTCSRVWKGQLISNSNDLARAYYKEWVKGSAKYEPSATEVSNFLSMYKQSTNFFI